MGDDIKKNRQHISVIRSFAVTWYDIYERYISAATFFAGFLWDTFTLSRIDSLAGTVLIFMYLVVAGLSIFLIQFFAAPDRKYQHFAPLLPFVIQFTFGALLSALFIYYFRSASFAGSWFFLALLGGILVGNEFLRSRYRLLEFQLSVFFVVLLAFMIFYVPIIFQHIGTDMFLAAGAISLLVTAFLIFILLRVIPSSERGGVRRKLLFGIGSSYLLFNVLYFANIIPPIPLVLKQAHVYHSVIRDESGRYIGEGEVQKWYEQYFIYAPTYHHLPNETVYFFSAVFAPTALKTPLVHEWQYFDAKNNTWTTVSKIVFPIMGGREEGYRAYSIKNNIIPGTWRVVVKTESGAVLGQENFTVVDVPAPVLLEKREL